MSNHTISPSSSTASSRPSLTARTLPKYALPVVLLVAVILAAAVSALVGFTLAGLVIFTAVFFLVGATLATRQVEGPRKAADRFVSYLVYAAFIIALLPLISVIWTVLQHGVPGLLTPGFLNTSMADVIGADDIKASEGEEPIIGGVYHAIIGTLVITFWATVVSVPVGLLTAIYLVEYSRDGILAKAITFFVDVMTGIPSIVAGLFAGALFGLLFGAGTKTGFVASVALSVLMIPVVVRSSEEMLKIVPHELREASYALGVRKWRTILKVVIPTVISGIASGITLAIARVIGETAPILVTAGFVSTINFDAFSGWMASLPTYIYRFLLNPLSTQAPEISEQRAWGAALVLIILVMLLNLLARGIAKVFAPKAGR